MRTMATFFVATVITISMAGGAAAHSHKHSCSDSHRHIRGDRDTYCFNDISTDFVRGTRSLRQTCGHDKVEITRDYELYINGKLISTDAEQKELLKDYYDGVMELTEYAEIMGREGAKIGVEGAKLGLNAVGGIFEVLLTSYDTEEFEADMEREASKLEVRAEKLEKMGSKLEDAADDLEHTHHELRRKIPELRELSWF